MGGEKRRVERARLAGLASVTVNEKNEMVSMCFSSRLKLKAGHK